MTRPRPAPGTLVDTQKESTMQRRTSSLLVALALVGGCAASSPRLDSYAPAHPGSTLAEATVVDGEVASEPVPRAEAPASSPETSPDASAAKERAPRPSAGLLTAGSFRDLDEYARFVSLFERGQAGAGELFGLDERWGFHLRGRVPVLVDDDGAPVVDARVRLYDKHERVVWEARTDNHGRAELFGALFRAAQGPYGVEVDSGGRVATKWGVDDASDAPVRLSLRGAKAPPAVLDLALLLDTTGSMGDELSYLQAELQDVVARARREAMRRGAGQDLDVRLSLGFYRDHGDAYVVRDHPFTHDVAEAARVLSSERADGGGDYPEALDEALLTFAERRDWSQSARARLALVVLDAPPHDHPEVKARLEKATRRFAEKGVRLVPVAASGVDRPTEGLLRLLQVATGGSYVFLTNHSGVGGDHLEPVAGDYRVEPLNDLLVRLIAEAAREVPAVDEERPAVAHAVTDPRIHLSRRDALR